LDDEEDYDDYGGVEAAVFRMMFLIVVSTWMTTRILALGTTTNACGPFFPHL